tara:strand:- start:656 stop:841 length:186 start_codon:yes stop_codon:yes gene_type:complete
MPDDTSWPFNMKWHDHNAEDEKFESYFAELKSEEKFLPENNETKDNEPKTTTTNSRISNRD